MTNREQQTLEHARLQLEQWRANHGPPSPLPADIWDTAVKLAARHGISPVARALRLDYGALKRRVNSGSAAAPSALPAAFVELVAPRQLPVIGRCVVEIESATGNELRLKLRDVAPATLAAIIREVLA